MADKGKDDQVKSFRCSLVDAVSEAPSSCTREVRSERTLSSAPDNMAGPVFWASLAPGTHCGAARHRSRQMAIGPWALAPY